MCSSDLSVPSSKSHKIKRPKYMDLNDRTSAEFLAKVSDLKFPPEQHSPSYLDACHQFLSSEIQFRRNLYALQMVRHPASTAFFCLLKGPM